MDGIVTAFTTAASTVSTNVSSMIAAALPVGLGIMGTILAIRVGVRFFKSICN